MGNNYINGKAVLFKIFCTLQKLILRRYFVTRPAVVLGAYVNIGAFAAAHCKHTFAVNIIYLAAHKVVEIIVNLMHLAAVPLADSVAVQK